MKQSDILEESNIMLRYNLRHRIITAMESYRLSFEQLSALANNKVTPEQLESFVRGNYPNINGIYLMRICSILGISISTIARGYFSYYESNEERGAIEGIINKSREVELLIKSLGGHMKKTAQDLLTGNTLIVGGPGTGKTYLTMEFIKELEEVKNSKILVVDYENEYEEFNGKFSNLKSFYEIGKAIPESIPGWDKHTFLVPKVRSSDMYNYLRNNAQIELEKILTHALNNDFNLLFLSPNAVSYFLIDHIENYQEYLKKIKVVVQVHALGFCADVNLEKFMNIIVFASHDVYTTDLLKKTFEIDVKKLSYQKRGEYQVLK